MRCRAAPRPFPAPAQPPASPTPPHTHTPRPSPTHPLLHPLFAFGASLGNEAFFVLFLTWLIWELDVEVARRAMAVWAVIYYVGQALKDVLALPRPHAARRYDAAALCDVGCCGSRCGRAAPAATPRGAPRPATARDGTWDGGVICLEAHYAAEYGMPSTHAMNSLGLPWAVFAWAARSGRFVGSLPALGAAAAAYTALCTTSRLYMGVHSHADLVVGLALGGAILAADLALGAAFDAWLLAPGSGAAALVPLAIAAAIAAYPKPRAWKTTPGDTAIVLGATAGVLASAAYDAPAQLRAAAPDALFTMGASPARLALALPRLAVGWGACFLARAIVKPLALALFTAAAEAALGPAFAPASEVAAGSRVGDTPAHIFGAGGGGGGSSGGGGGGARDASDAHFSGARGGDDGLRHRAAAAGRGAGASAASGSDASTDAGGGGDAGAGAGAGGAAAAAPGALRIKAPPPSVSPRDASPGGGELVPLPPAQRYAVELPTKLVVYASLGVTAMLIVPPLHAALGLSIAGLR